MKTKNEMLILAVDPGTTQSGWVIYDPIRNSVVNCGIDKNQTVMDLVRTEIGPDLWFVCERISCQGMAVGQETFDTVEFIGALFHQALGPRGWDRRHDFMVKRTEVKIHLCGTARAKDPNIRQAILDRFPATGGGKCPQVGTKKQPGPLFGVHAHIWSALAVALTWNETKRKDLNILEIDQ
jgi:hypothetical protein